MTVPVFIGKTWYDWPDLRTPVTANAIEDIETRVTTFAKNYADAVVGGGDDPSLGPINVTDSAYGCLPGLPDSRAGFDLAYADGLADCRPLYFPGGTLNYVMSGTVVEWDGTKTYWKGDGRNSIVQFTDPNGGWSMGDIDNDGFGSGAGMRNLDCGGVCLWGGPAAGSEVCLHPLRITQAVQAIFSNMEIKFSAADGILLEQSQNCNFLNVNSQENLGAGLIIDRGAGGHGFFRCELSDNHKTNLTVQETVHRSSGYQRPSDNHFYACIFERLRYMTDPANSTSVRITAGNTISFQGCNFVATSGTLDGCIFEIAPLRFPTLKTGTSYATNFKFNDCWFFGSQNAVAIDAFRIVGTTEITFSGHNNFQNPGTADRGYGGAGGAMFATDDTGTLKINNYGTFDSDYNVQFRNMPYTTILTANVTLPASTVTVDDTTQYASAGSVDINGNLVTYTGKTATTFTGCTGGSGLQTAGTYVEGAATSLSGNHTFPIATVTVPSTTGFPTTGTIFVGGQIVKYTGKSGTTFTGCTGGTGTISGGTRVKQIGTQSADSIIRSRFEWPVQVTRNGTGDNGFILSIVGESGSRFLVKGSGVYIGDGSSNSTSSGFVNLNYFAQSVLGIVGGLRLSSSSAGALELVRQGSTPAAPGAAGAKFYTKLDGSVSRLMMQDEAGKELTIASTNTDTGFTTVSVSASPFKLHNIRILREQVIIRGGTVSLVELSRDDVNYEDIGVVAGVVSLEPGDYLRVTYTVAPTMKRMSRAA